MLAKALAVVRGDRDQGLCELPRRPQGVDQSPERGVGVRHLGVIGRESRRVRLRRAVGFVGVVEVDPGKEGLRA